MALSLVSVNIEFDRHFDTVLPFLERQRPDVTCVQELLEKDIPAFEKVCGPCIGFSPIGYQEHDGAHVGIGEGIFTKFPGETRSEYYVGSPETLRFDDGVGDIGTHGLLIADIETPDGPYRIITTHFTWSPKGMVNDEQREHIQKMLSLLSSHAPFVLCGDFNARRGAEIFGLLAEHYTDNIPASYEASLDPVLHTKAGHPLPYMVDGLFTTPEYTASNVALIQGVSDHCAIVADIERNTRA